MADVELRSYDIAGERLHYTDVGEGVPVVLVHGGFGDYRQWGALTGALSSRFRVISYSRRGAYPNHVSMDTLPSIAVHASDLSILISRLSKAPVHLVGESYGACVALRCAARAPGLVRTLTIDEPPLPLLLRGREDLSDRREFEEQLAGSVAQYTAGRSETGAMGIIDYLEGMPAFSALPEAVKTAIAANAPGTFEDMKAGLEGVSMEDLASLRMPVLLLKSQVGPRVLKRVTDVVSELIPGGRLVEVSGATHGTLTESSGYVDAVQAFLQEN